MQVLGEVYCFGPSMSGLGFWSYFRSCLGTQGQSASRDGMGSGWPFYHTLVGRWFGLCFAFFPPQAKVASFGFHCVDSTGACQRDLGLEEPWSQPWQSRDAALPVLVQPQQGRTLSREAGGVQERGSERSPAWAGPEALCEGCGAAAIALSLGPGEPAGRTPPGTPWPASNIAGARGGEDPWARSQPGLSEGQCPCKERRERMTSLSTLGGVFQSTLQRPNWLPQGLTLHWEWISTRAFDCGQIRLHSPRLSCQILD